MCVCVCVCMCVCGVWEGAQLCCYTVAPTVSQNENSAMFLLNVFQRLYRSQLHVTPNSGGGAHVDTAQQFSVVCACPACVVFCITMVIAPAHMKTEFIADEYHCWRAHTHTLPLFMTSRRISLPDQVHCALGEHTWP